MSDFAQVEPRATPVHTDYGPSADASVVSVHRDSSGLCVHVKSETWEAQVLFETDWGFRVLGELDLSEFWRNFSLRDGWLFEVHAGGWLDLERTRPSFTSGRLYQLREYIVVGTGNCVSVIAEQAPDIRGAPSNNSFNPMPLRGTG